MWFVCLKFLSIMKMISFWVGLFWVENLPKPTTDQNESIKPNRNEKFLFPVTLIAMFRSRKLIANSSNVVHFIKTVTLILTNRCARCVIFFFFTFHFFSFPFLMIKHWELLILVILWHHLIMRALIRHLIIILKNGVRSYAIAHWMLCIIWPVNDLFR